MFCRLILAAFLCGACLAFPQGGIDEPAIGTVTVPTGVATPTVPSGVATPTVPSGVATPTVPSGVATPTVPSGVVTPTIPNVTPPAVSRPTLSPVQLELIAQLNVLGYSVLVDVLLEISPDQLSNNGQVPTQWTCFLPPKEVVEQKLREAGNNLAKKAEFVKSLLTSFIRNKVEFDRKVAEGIKNFLNQYFNKTTRPDGSVLLNGGQFQSFINGVNSTIVKVSDWMKNTNKTIAQYLESQGSAAGKAFINFIKRVLPNLYNKLNDASKKYTVFLPSQNPFSPLTNAITGLATANNFISPSQYFPSTFGNGATITFSNGATATVTKDSDGAVTLNYNAGGSFTFYPTSSMLTANGICYPTD